MEAVEARIEAKGGSKWGNFAAAEAKLSSSLIEPDSKTWWLKPEWKKGEVAGIAETVFLASSPYYPLSSSWPFSRSFLLRLASWMELGRQVGSTIDHYILLPFQHSDIWRKIVEKLNNQTHTVTIWLSWSLSPQVAIECWIGVKMWVTSTF